MFFLVNGGFQNLSVKLTTWLLRISTPSCSKSSCMSVGVAKWTAPVRRPLLLTTRCAGTGMGFPGLVHGPAYHPGGEPDAGALGDSPIAGDPPAGYLPGNLENPVDEIRLRL